MRVRTRMHMSLYIHICMCVCIYMLKLVLCSLEGWNSWFLTAQYTAWVTYDTVVSGYLLIFFWCFHRQVCFLMYQPLYPLLDFQFILALIFLFLSWLANVCQALQKFSSFICECLSSYFDQQIETCVLQVSICPNIQTGTWCYNSILEV